MASHPWQGMQYAALTTRGKAPSFDNMALGVLSCHGARVPKKAQEPDRALASVLRGLREERKESQETLAYRAGMTSGSLARIELAQAVPSWVTVRALATALGISLVDLAARVEHRH